MSSCATCARLAPTIHYPKFAELGMGRCLAAPVATFHTLNKQRECAKYEVSRIKGESWNNKNK
jgi:hypothetical protein